MKEKIKETIEQVLYTNLNYPVRGNRYILAANLILDYADINDIDLVCKLSKILEENSGFEVSNEEHDIIYKSFLEIVSTYRTKTKFY